MFNATKVIKKMETKQETKKIVPRHGFINELARLCQCSRHTVRLAIYDNQKGKKSDFVRKMYKTKYINF